jgi:hypothetical protein
MTMTEQELAEERLLMVNFIGGPQLDHALDYLDKLRLSGVTNMFGAAPYLVAWSGEWDIHTARKVLSYWMKTFESRQGGG